MPNLKVRCPTVRPLVRKSLPITDLDDLKKRIRRACGQITQYMLHKARRNLMSYLEKLLQTTEGIRKYKCEQCFKSFFEKHHLTIHLRVHTGEKPYACKISGCGKSFTESQKLSRHLKARHQKQTSNV